MNLIKMAVHESSSLSRSTGGNETAININEQQSMFNGKNELPGRTLEFDFDFSPFSLSNSRHSSPKSGNKKQTGVNNSVKQYNDQNYETEFLS
jgi:hypothetical protein